MARLTKAQQRRRQTYGKPNCQTCTGSGVVEGPATFFPDKLTLLACPACRPRVQITTRPRSGARRPTA